MLLYSSWWKRQNSGFSFSFRIQTIPLTFLEVKYFSHLSPQIYPPPTTTHNPELHKKPLHMEAKYIWSPLKGGNTSKLLSPSRANDLSILAVKGPGFPKILGGGGKHSCTTRSKSDYTPQQTTITPKITQRAQGGGGDLMKIVPGFRHLPSIPLMTPDQSQVLLQA